MQSEVVAAKAAGWAHRKLTPMLRQYVDAKKLCPPQCILMFRMGDFFELFFEDAEIAARELGITLTARDKGDNPIPMAGVPHHAIGSYVAKLVGRGYSVAMCDQMEDPKAAKGIVRRAITRLITPGTATDLEALDPGAATYLGCVLPCPNDPGRVALALLDLLAGQLLCTTLPTAGLADEVERMGVREVLLAEPLMAPHAEALRQARAAVRRLPDNATAYKSADNAAFVATRVGTQDIAGLTREGGESLHGLHRRTLHMALAAVIRFAEETQRCELRHIMAPQAYDMARYLVLDETSRRNLELFRSGVERSRHGALLWHLDQTRTPMGSRLLAQWLLFPLQDADAIGRRADAVAFFKADRVRRQAVHKALGAMHDLERLTGRVALDRATPRDLGAILQTLEQVPALQETLLADVPPAAQAWLSPWRDLDMLPGLANGLRSALADDLPLVTNEGGIFRMGYRDDLDELIMLSTQSHGYLADLEARERARTGIASLKVRYNRVYGYYLEVTRANAAQVPADYIRKQTLVNAERYITPELKTFEDKVVDADGRRRSREAELFAELLASAVQCVGRLRRLARTIARVDVLAALGEVAEIGRYTRPQLLAEPELTLVEARHPVLERLMPGGERFVPNDVHLHAKDKQLMVVTGPNMAGKSTTMRQAALCVIMAQMGSFVPAKSARIGLCDRIFTRVGAADDLGRGHSTFMVEMVETAAILRCATAKSLVLLDEIGRGTSTFDGVSIAWAVAEHLHDVVRCRGLFATHYHELTALADSHPRIFNASVAIKHDADRLVFLRHLVPGGASRSYGIEVARMAALPDAVLHRAKHILQSLESRNGAPAAARTAGMPPEESLPSAEAAIARPAAGYIRRTQLPLFDGPAQSSAATVDVAGMDALVTALTSLSVDEMTPVQALVALARLKKKAQRIDRTRQPPAPSCGTNDKKATYQ